MISIENAARIFENYVSHYDVTDPKISLKIRHTHAVADACGYLAKALDLNEEDRNLALLIGLLHDIGRFEQLARFGSYDDALLSHASCGLEILFEQGHIRDYLSTDKYDAVIYAAIKNHSLYAIDPSLEGRTLLHARIIRDADKLDNFRVKATEPIPSMLDISAEELGSVSVSKHIYESILRHEQIRREDRHTKMDTWVSFLAFIFDFNFPASHQYVLDHHCIENNIDRILYSNPDTAGKMNVIRETALQYCQECAAR